MTEAARRAQWRALVERRLPEAARPDWPVRLDHCFARILLDNTCGGPWRDHVRPPAYANMPLDRLEGAIALGEAVLAGDADLALLNRRSLAWRGKIAPAVVPETLRDGDLILRRWRPEDTAPFAALNADPTVMAHFPRPRTAAESAAEAGIFDRRFVADGFGPWAVEHAGRFIGFAGAMRILQPLPFPGGDRPGRTVELAWRLARDAWGHGFATRAARCALADLSKRCGIRAVVAFTAAGNTRSRAVMERIDMVPAGTFSHPAVPEGPLRTHVLYRLDCADREVAA
ncbi:GNAT family N-acetyltransferase [Methylobacterium sp. E-005]|uniref:GNAT family N-acetyltransferase n=1 Tax=Methylobacterium sp. E-005 TaxID=2836549 RepID=UPI001FB89044|nr:GNAT family N-acetyltransferase [Methylobacterium sp. E-005]MCJ2086057.1 GNAT family N-acetyltransferase [Methylobacterium sp. E-005]